MGFQESGLARDNGVVRGVRLVEPISCEVLNVFPKRIAHVFGVAPGPGSGRKLGLVLI